MIMSIMIKAPEPDLHLGFLTMNAKKGMAMLSASIMAIRGHRVVKGLFTD